MAQMPDGWIVTVEALIKRLEARIPDSRELVICKNCPKRGLDNCPMAFNWDSHPAEDNGFLQDGRTEG